MKPVRAIRCLTFAATLAAAVLLPAAVVSAAVYVADAQSPAASDDNPGSEAKPFKTIAAAVKVAKAGDTVCVMAGDYAERVKLTASGAAGQPLVLKSLPPHAATMRGFDTGGQSYLRIEGFHVVSDNPADRTPGIALTGAGQGIEVVSNFVEGMYMG
ncbi:MAG: DUF1565 domain-containing protein, partial [Planctomycetes bacterium]|nr:DUF1565 domain-containing protein [Planctomycetota bacterium]